MSERVPEERNLVCDECGRFEAVAIGEHHLCVDCYEGCGSCCPEFGVEDWDFSDESDPAKAAAQPAHAPPAKGT